MVKLAAAQANRTLGTLSEERCKAITAAAQEIIDGQFHDQFPVDVFQGGAGTSTNMNMNEVLAHRGRVLMGHARDDAAALHQNDHVNLSQSTNDTYPTAVRLSVLLSIEPLSAALDRLASSFEAKSTETAQIVKLGRTQLQDAVPMTVGQELGAYAATIREDIQRLTDASVHLCEVNLGGTAIGTRINADPAYGKRAIAELATLSGFPLVQSANLIEASWDMGAFVMFSGVLKRIATAVEDRQRHQAVVLGPARRDRRICHSGDAAGVLDHAGQGQSGHPRGAEHRLLPGHRQRPGRHDGGGGRATATQRVRAVDRPQHPVLDDAADQRDRHVHGTLHRRDRSAAGTMRPPYRGRRIDRHCPVPMSYYDRVAAHSASPGGGPLDSPEPVPC